MGDELMYVCMYVYIPDEVFLGGLYLGHHLAFQYLIDSSACL